MEYLDSRIASANEAQLVAIVYEGLIEKLNESIYNIKKDDKLALNESIVKSREIIAELLATLKGNFQVAQNYKSLYMYLNKLITRANIKKDIKVLEEAISIVTPLLEGWTELGEKMFKEEVEKGQDSRIMTGMTYGKGHLNDDTTSSGSSFEA